MDEVIKRKFIGLAIEPIHIGSRKSGVLSRVPTPERYALHKLRALLDRSPGQDARSGHTIDALADVENLNIKSSSDIRLLFAAGAVRR